MKNFDTEAVQRAASNRDERAFVLGGETFHAIPEVAPEVLTRFESIDDEDDKTPLSETMAVVDETILALIEDEPDDGHARYRQMRASSPNVGVPTLLELAQWLVGVQTGRPTEPSPPSPDSPETPTGTTSTDDSSSEDTPEA